ncbi:MAG: hypothetical protein RL559_1179 [Pseudomonadota bacterium]
MAAQADSPSGARVHHADESALPPEAPRPPDLAPQALCEQVLQQRYLQPGERHADDLWERVALALAQAEPVAQRGAWAARFRQHLARGALPSGRILAGAGTGLHSTWASGFVQPVADCVLGRDDAGRPGIYEALGETAETLRRGGGVGLDFSLLRPRGALVRSTASLASGPCSYIDVFEQSCATLASAGTRQALQMAVLRIDHPDVLAFIEAQHSHDRWRHVRTTVAVPDAFMQAVAEDAACALVHRAPPGQALIDQGAHWRGDGQWVYRSLPARVVWDALLHAAHATGAPGLLFLDTVQRDNNLRSLETLIAATPQGEQVLPAHGGCVHGALVLPRYVRAPFVPGQAQIDFAALAESAGVLVRLLDNALELGWWPLPAQHREAHTKRRIGLGMTGLADTLAMLGLRYDREDGRAMAARIARCLRDAAYRSSVALARERGPYPLFNAQTCLAEGTFASRLPAELQAEIRAHGLRNSHLLSIAPARGISLALADNCASGIALPQGWVVRHSLPQLPHLHAHGCPVAHHAFRRYTAQGGGAAPLPEVFLTAAQVAPSDQIAMLAALQPFVDAGIAQTVQLPPTLGGDAWAALCLQAWRQGLKGLTVCTASDPAPPVQQPLPLG